MSIAVLVKIHSDGSPMNIDVFGLPPTINTEGVDEYDVLVKLEKEVKKFEKAKPGNRAFVQVQELIEQP